MHLPAHAYLQEEDARNKALEVQAARLAALREVNSAREHARDQARSERAAELANKVPSEVLQRQASVLQEKLAALQMQLEDEQSVGAGGGGSGVLGRGQQRGRNGGAGLRGGEGGITLSPLGARRRGSVVAQRQDELLMLMGLHVSAQAMKTFSYSAFHVPTLSWVSYMQFLLPIQDRPWCLPCEMQMNSRF